MVTFAEKAEVENSEHPTKYVTSKFTDNDTQLYYQTTPHHPTENVDSDERYLELQLETPHTQDSIEKLLDFLALTRLSQTRASSLLFSTVEDEQIKVVQLYIPELDINHYNARLSMPRAMSESQRFEDFSSLFSRIMDDFYGIKIGLTYDDTFHNIERKGKDKSEGIIGSAGGTYGGGQPDKYEANIFQTPVRLNVSDIVRKFFELEESISYAYIESISSPNGEYLCARCNPGSSIKFEFYTDSTTSEKRILYGNEMFNIYQNLKH
jgi:hypothetical protein